MKTCDILLDRPGTVTMKVPHNAKTLPQATRTKGPGSQAQADGLALCQHTEPGVELQEFLQPVQGILLPFVQQAHGGFRFRV